MPTASRQARPADRRRRSADHRYARFRAEPRLQRLRRRFARPGEEPAAPARHAARAGADRPRPAADAAPARRRLPADQRADRLSPDIKILVLSGQSDETNARHARTLGAIEFVAKPCEPERLKALLLKAREITDAELRAPKSPMPASSARGRPIDKLHAADRAVRGRAVSGADRRRIRQRQRARGGVAAPSKSARNEAVSGAELRGDLA